MDWRIKAAIQFALAHLPYGEQLNHIAQRANGSFSPRVLLREMIIQAAYIRRLNQRFPLTGKTVLEIGPGWAASGTLSLALFGVERVYAFDHQKHFRLPLIQRLADACLQNIDSVAAETEIDPDSLRERLWRIASARTLDSCLDAMHVAYCAPADAARTGLSRASVDMVYSYGVLEHIPLKALEAIMLETARILKPGGRACHNIGLHDHFHSAGLGNGVNFLRYSERRWNFISTHLNYHNRLRLPQYLSMFSRHGLLPVWQERELLDLNINALRKLCVHPQFSRFSEHDLAASHLFVDLVAASG